jgi:hypothetical protein
MSTNFGSFFLPSGMTERGQSNQQLPNFGSNQYMNYPSMNNSYYPMQNSMAPTPGIVSPTTSSSFTNQPYMSAQQETPSGQYTSPTVDPFLTSSLGQYFQSMLGKGATPFDLSAILPSTGQATTPGSLTAPMNPILQSLMQFYQTGQGGPLPGVLPMWNTEMQAMNIPIQQQLANIKEQFGSRGALGSSEAANAFAQFGEQTALEQESLLGQLTMQALPGMEQFGGALQSLDQQSIQNLYNEFLRTQPEYSPLLPGIESMATTFPGMTDPKQGIGSAILGGLGSLAQTAGAVLPFTGL